MADIIIGFLQCQHLEYLQIQILSRGDDSLSPQERILKTYLVYDILFIATKSGFVGILDADIVETQ